MIKEQIFELLCYCQYKIVSGLNHFQSNYGHPNIHRNLGSASEMTNQIMALNTCAIINFILTPFFIHTPESTISIIMFSVLLVVYIFSEIIIWKTKFNEKKYLKFKQKYKNEKHKIAKGFIIFLLIIESLSIWLFSMFIFPY